MKIKFIIVKDELMVQFQDSWYNPFDNYDFKIIRDFIKELSSERKVKVVR